MGHHPNEEKVDESLAGSKGVKSYLGNGKSTIFITIQLEKMMIYHEIGVLLPYFWHFVSPYLGGCFQYVSHVSVECLVGLPSSSVGDVFENTGAPSNTGRIGEAVLLDLCWCSKLAGNDSELTRLRPPGDRMMWFLWAIFIGQARGYIL